MHQPFGYIVLYMNNVVLKLVSLYTIHECIFYVKMAENEKQIVDKTQQNNYLKTSVNLLCKDKETTTDTVTLQHFIT